MNLKLPPRSVAGNLVFAGDRSVWAVWRAEPVSYRYLSEVQQEELHTRTRTALMRLPEEALLFSVCQRLAPDELTEIATRGVDLDAHPPWAELCGWWLDHYLEGLALYNRRTYVAVRLPGEGVSAKARRVVQAPLGAARWATGGVRHPIRAGAQAVHTLGSAWQASRQAAGAPFRPSELELERRTREAERIEARLRTSITLHAPRAGEILWLYARALRRGGDEPVLDSSWSHEPGSAKRVAISEGRMRSRATRLEIETPFGASHQALLAVADMPPRFIFPGDKGEWFVHADALPFPVDWAVRIRPISNQKAQAAARRQARNLSGQIEEHDEDPAGPPRSLADAIESVAHQRGELESNPTDPELQCVIAFCTYGEDVAAVEAQATQISDLFAPNEYMVPRPTGGQKGLFQLMLPGTPLPQVARDYLQYLLPRDLAAGMPFAGTEIGDPSGMLLGFSLDSGALRPIFWDPSYGPGIDRPASVGFVGDRGSGKSYLMKLASWVVGARDGQVVVLDRDPRGEWARFAEAVPGRTRVIRVAPDTQVCLDPLRVFPPGERVRRAIDFLCLLARTSISETEGATIAKATREVALVPEARLLDVVNHLEREGASDEYARTVARKLQVFTESDLAGLAFGEGEQLALAWDDYLVFHLPDLILPDREILLSEGMSKQLSAEEIFGLAAFYLVAAVARSVAFSDTSRFGVVVCDETWAILGSIQGRQLLLEGLRNERKGNAALWLASQHPDDFGHGPVAHLLGNRFVGAQAPGAGPAALRFLGVEPSSELIDRLEAGYRRPPDADEEEPSRFLWRDVRGRIGEVAVIPAPPWLRESIETNPLKVKARVPTVPGEHPPVGPSAPVGPIASTNPNGQGRP